MRHRLEDLGRIAAFIDQALEDSIFQIVQTREKDYYDVFFKMTHEEQDNVIDEFAYGVSRIKEKFYHLLSIAEGTDDLNALFDRDFVISREPMDS